MFEKKKKKRCLQIANKNLYFSALIPELTSETEKSGLILKAVREAGRGQEHLGVHKRYILIM